MDDRVWPALLLLIPVVGASAQPLPEGAVVCFAPAPGEPAFTGYARIALAPNGRAVAIADDSGRLDLWDISGKRLKTLRTTGPKCVSPRWSPDGRRLFAGHKEGVAVWDVTNPGEPRVLASGPKSTDGRQIAVSPDGKFVVANGSGPMTVCWDAETGEERWRTQYDGPIGVSPDSRFVVRSHFGQRFDFLDAATGKEASSFGLPLISCRHTASDSFTFSPDGRSMAVFVNANLGVRDARTGREFWEKGVGIYPVNPPVFSPDGHWLVTTGRGTTFIIWDAATGQILHECKSDGPCLTSIDFTSDGRRILTASSDGTVLLRDLVPSEPPPSDLFSALRSNQGDESYAAIWAFARDSNGPAELRKLIPIQPRLSANQLDRLIADLDAARHPVRERASRVLSDQGRTALPVLRSALERVKSAEAAARLEKLIQAAPPELTSQEITHRRAVKAMSLAGTAEARELLAGWAAGAPGAVLTEEAKAALGRR
jgi:outer membrane protein assembly factor BamB